MVKTVHKKRARVAVKNAVRPTRAAAEPRLLAGGNPQIAKGEGDGPVRAYVAAMPGWKRRVGRRLDGIITRTVPDVRKAVKWNSPLYGAAGDGWFLGIHCYTDYVKVTFFRGASLRPLPPGESKQKDVRHVDIREDDRFDESQFTDWVKQASRLPGQRMRARARGRVPHASARDSKMKKGTPGATGPKRGPKGEADTDAASRRIDLRIHELGGWRGQTLARVRALIRQADPGIVEEWKWNVPVWSRDGIICTGEAYKSAVKLTFAKGASLEDPSGLFNSSLEGNTRRAIDIREGEKINERVFKTLIRAAAALNTSNRGDPEPATSDSKSRRQAGHKVAKEITPRTRR